MRKKNMVKIKKVFLFQKSLNQIRILIWSLEFGVSNYFSKSAKCLKIIRKQLFSLKSK